MPLVGPGVHRDPRGAGLERDDALRDVYRRAIAVRRAHPALWRGSHETVDHGADHLVFRRADPESGDVVWVAVNRSEQPLTLAMPVDDVHGALVDALTGDRFELEGSTVSVELAPLSGRVLSAGVARSTD